MKPTGGPYLLLLFFMTTLFGFSFVATKIALEGLGVFQVVFGRYSLAFLALLVIFWRRRQYFFIARSDWKDFLILTFIEPVGYFIFETYGLRFTSPANVSLIIATIPVFAVIFAAFLLKEKPNRFTWIGVFLSIVGVYFIIRLQESSQLAPHPFWGSLLTLVAAMSAGLYNSLARRLTRRYSPLTITFYQTLVATLFFLPLALWEFWQMPDVYVDWRIAGSIFYLAIGSSVIAYFILNHALARLGAAQVAIFANFVPVVTILASYVVYREMLKPLQLVGAVLVLTGIYFTYYRAAASSVAD